MRGRALAGYCTLCQASSHFVVEETSRPETMVCWRCDSQASARALVYVLEESFPHWRDQSVHESSPQGPISEKLFRECPRYLPSRYFLNVPRGEVVKGIRCEDLCAQTFPANRFDLVITSHVFEYLLSPRDGFTEIARTLKPGGAHVFTTAWHPERPTVTRARMENGQITHLESPIRRGNPGDENGSLLITDWGYELPHLVQTWSGLVTTVYRLRDRKLGLDGAFFDVFVSRKLPAPALRA